jgi:aryl-alcohol dehydrogenase-like predicted oxidoreductase
VLSGKYTRENAGDVKADRGERVTQNLGEKVYAIIEALIAIGRELNASPASVALAWVQRRPGVASTIIGARRLDQLEQNLAALDITLSADHVARLDTLSKPTLSFPMQFLNVAGMFSQGGTTVNGEPSTVWPLAPKTDSERY